MTKTFMEKLEGKFKLYQNNYGSRLRRYEKCFLATDINQTLAESLKECLKEINITSRYDEDVISKSRASDIIKKHFGDHNKESRV